ncbi:hypothetical protein RchiOBHm_Chr2g0102601 [Rosa chinensis]|uniref:Uncharacterized protein n=1 Tax=Rosa chinensis TaxID=74649 RepID=A0A2P6RMT3_ROSCH|nr:hypothetical protein RchiOBHm_Chr2g0102601 [Rosa chinensis]
MLKLKFSLSCSWLFQRETKGRSKKFPIPVEFSSQPSQNIKARLLEEVPKLQRLAVKKVERRRTVTPRPNSLDLRAGNGAAGGGEMSASQKLLVTSTRSLSVSFQGESYAL